MGTYDIQQEILIRSTLVHPNIIKLYEVFEDAVSIYMVLEYCEGGHLFDRVVAATGNDYGSFPETDVAIVMQQILMATQFMHERRIVHRLLKPKSVQALSAGPISSGNPVKIIDFTAGVVLEPGSQGLRMQVAGGPHYMAPEMSYEPYNEKVDLFSIGVMMYVMLAGYYPFDGDTADDIWRSINKGVLYFDTKKWPGWSKVSICAKNLLHALLQRDPSKRFSAEEALAQQWLMEPGACTTTTRAPVTSTTTAEAETAESNAEQLTASKACDRGSLAVWLLAIAAWASR
eukprot:gnl/TRDRNA2_/TRDRNA2_148172_c0_seq1.p1 gnl/TRDRNA2_/TRDRNA2_148172_c0~~gnl/TRDRNA2_/TRDRNA2_148172_c0_seq1.p1  ORF type:complete len:338 (-),score=70.49 gnl/TRDRNA2_/TRDRNA2_148172_c0_seq1:28-891(-)